MIKLGNFQMTTVLCDFIKITGDGETLIVDVQGGQALPNFNTGGRRADQTALLVYSVKNVVGAPQVFINGKKVGTITATLPNGSASLLNDIYFMQSIEVQGNEIKDGQPNKIVVKNVTQPSTIKNVNLFFHQND